MFKWENIFHEGEARLSALHIHEKLDWVTVTGDYEFVYFHHIHSGGRLQSIKPIQKSFHALRRKWKQ